ncbi:MAG: DNA repair protein RecO [Bacteroidaceae bacterium]|nr:DNA repair protein RecO [Bacteroidaceae bacterium]
MLEKVKGVVLYALRYGEDSLIVDIYTERYGTLPFLVKAQRQRRASVHTQLLRPLNILELEFDYRPSLSLQRIRGMRLEVAYNTLPYEPVKQTLALFLSELLHHALRHEAANPPLLHFLQCSMQWLDKAKGNVGNFHIVFMLQLTRHLGLCPDVEAVEGTVHFDLQDGMVKPGIPQGGHCLSVRETALLPLFMRLSFPTMHLLRMTREQRARALDLLILYFRLHVAEFPELKSTEILRELMA